MVFWCDYSCLRNFEHIRVQVWGYIFRFAIKSTVVGGTVYYTYQEGLWSKSEETAKLYNKLYVNVAPYVKENIPEEITKEVILYGFPEMMSLFVTAQHKRSLWFIKKVVKCEIEIVQIKIDLLLFCIINICSSYFKYLFIFNLRAKNITCRLFSFVIQVG